MLDLLSRYFRRAPARLVRLGLGLFFAGAGALLAAALAQLAAAPGPQALGERLPGLPTWFVPESPAGYTLAASLVCWGVWAIGAGLQQARGRSGRP